MPVRRSQGTCPECGGGLTPGTTDCPECAEDGGGPSPVESCPACAAPIPPESERCGACGVALFGEGSSVSSPVVPRSTNEYRTFATVFEGPLGEALQLQQVLAEVRIESFVPALDERLGPGAEGGGHDFQSVHLMVRRDAERVAAAAIGEWRRGTGASSREQRTDPEAELARLGRRIRGVFFNPPFALWLGIGYVRRCAALPRRPEGHGYTLAALVMSAAMLLFGAGVAMVLLGAFA